MLPDGGANQEEDPGGRAEWNQGRNTGRWISRQAPLLEQGQVLLVNAVRNCGQLSVDLLKRVSSALSVPRRQASHAQALAAHLLGVSVSLLKRTLQMVDMNGGQPTVTEPDRPAVSVVHQQRPTWRQECEVSVRLALGCAYERQTTTMQQRQ